MSKQIEGVPESIIRATYLDMIRTAGFDVDRIQSLEFRPDGIYATVKWCDEGGRERIDPGTNDVIKHHVYVPVVD